VTTAGLGAPVQIAYAVPDARAAAQQWVDRFGAGPFFVRSHIPVGEVVYRGQPSTFDHTSAYGQWGSLMVELVQDHGTAPSVVRERCAPHESGLHHLAFIVADLDLMSAYGQRPGQRLVGCRPTDGPAVYQPGDRGLPRCHDSQRQRLELTPEGGVDGVDGAGRGICDREMRRR